MLHSAVPQFDPHQHTRRRSSSLLYTSTEAPGREIYLKMDWQERPTVLASLFSGPNTTGLVHVGLYRERCLPREVYNMCEHADMLTCLHADMLACWRADILTHWHSDMLKYLHVDMLRCRHVDMLTCWHVDMFTCWRADMLTCWHAEMFTCWHVDMLTCWHAYILTCWHVDMLTCWHAPQNMTRTECGLYTVRVSEGGHTGLC